MVIPAHKSLQIPCFFVAVYPMINKKSENVAEGLKSFINEYGIMSNLVMDGATEQTGQYTEMVKTMNRYNIKYHIIEPERYNHNKAEAAIREMKKKWFQVMS